MFPPGPSSRVSQDHIVPMQEMLPEKQHQMVVCPSPSAPPYLTSSQWIRHLDNWKVCNKVGARIWIGSDMDMVMDTDMNMVMDTEFGLLKVTLTSRHKNG